MHDIGAFADGGLAQKLVARILPGHGLQIDLDVRIGLLEGVKRNSHLLRLGIIEPEREFDRSRPYGACGQGHNSGGANGRDKPLPVFHLPPHCSSSTDHAELAPFYGIVNIDSVDGLCQRLLGQDRTSAGPEVEDGILSQMRQRKPGPRQVRIEDVARIVGVSAMTVSRVIREPERVAASTRVKIQEAMAAISYVPNRVAASLKSQRTGIIACIIPSIEHSFAAEAIRGASEVLRPQGFHVILGESGFSSIEEEELVLAFLSGRPDAMILTGLTHTPGTRRLLATSGIPVVEVGNIAPKPIDMVVGFSNAEASRQITAAMIAKGHKRIGYLLQKGSSENDRIRDRHTGYRRAVREAGNAAAEGPTVEVGFSYHGGAEGLTQMLSSDRKVDGICCSNDIVALGALYECQRSGIDVPGGVGIAGFDEHGLASQCVPPLSTVRIPRMEMGRQVGVLIQRALTGDTQIKKRADVGFELKLRGTF